MNICDKMKCLFLQIGDLFAADNFLCLIDTYDILRSGLTNYLSVASCLIDNRSGKPVTLSMYPATQKVEYVCDYHPMVPGSNPKHNNYASIFQFIFELNCEQDENKQKGQGLAHLKKFHSLFKDQSIRKYRVHQRFCQKLEMVSSNHIISH